MTINDGFGEPQVEDQLAEKDSWLHWAARQTIAVTDPRFGDVLQEGRIEFWRAYNELADAGEDRLRFSLHRARQRMRHVAYRNGAPTGHTRLPGRPEVQAYAVLDRPLSDDGTATLASVLLGASDALEGVEIAYHHGQIMDAIASLDEDLREYVVLRFWHGYTDTEIAARQGLSTSGMHNRWVRKIRPHLQRYLGHLVGASR